MSYITPMAAHRSRRASGIRGLEIDMSKNSTSKTAYTHIVIAEYSYADKVRGDVISKHRSYAAANKKANKSTFWGIREIAEAK